MPQGDGHPGGEERAAAKTTGKANAISPGPGGSQVMAEVSNASGADKPLMYHANATTPIAA